MDDDLDVDALMVLRAVSSASTGEREVWVSVDETVDALTDGQLVNGRVRPRGADRWRGLRPVLEELRRQGLVHLHVGAMPMVPHGQPVPIAEPDNIEITAPGWSLLTRAA